MNTKDNRLAKKRDFDLLLKYGRWVNGAILDIKYLELAPAFGGQAKLRYPLPKNVNYDNFILQLRLAYAAGLKISKKAVERNRLKRQLREAVRLLDKEFSLREGFYIMLAPKKIMLGKSYAEISAETKVLLQKIKVI